MIIELVVNNEDVYRTDYDLNETIKYKLANIESQIPALLLLTSKKKVCRFLKNSQSSEFISDLNIISDNGSLKIISYKKILQMKLVHLPCLIKSIP